MSDRHEHFIELVEDVAAEQRKGEVRQQPSVYRDRAEALATALRKLGRRCQLMSTDQPDGYVVNVWVDLLRRFPDDTIHVNSEGYTWGPKSDHWMAPSAPSAEVAEFIIETVLAR